MDTFKGLYDYRIERGRIAEQMITGAMTKEEGLKAMRALRNPFTRFKEYQEQHGGDQSAPSSTETKKDTGIHKLTDEELDKKIREMSGQ
jgi:hypothetical protein